MSIPFCDDQARLPQNHQMLRNARLPGMDYRFQVADACLLRTDRQQNLNAGGLANERQGFRDRDLRGYTRGNIRGHEYYYTVPANSRSGTNVTAQADVHHLPIPIKRLYGAPNHP